MEWITFLTNLMILTNSSDFSLKLNNFQNMRILFLIVGIIFFIISIVLFIRFDIKRNIFVNVKHKQKRVPKARVPRSQKLNATGHRKVSEDTTEKLSEETALLENEYDKTALLDEDETQVLDEVQLQFSIEKSVEMYSGGEEG